MNECRYMGESYTVKQKKSIVKQFVFVSLDVRLLSDALFGVLTDNICKVDVWSFGRYGMKIYLWTQ